jgi:hypothetical protein
MRRKQGNTYIGCISHRDGRNAVCGCGKTIEFEHRINYGRGEGSACLECAKEVLCRSDRYMPLFAEKSFQGGWKHVVPTNPPYGWMSRWHIEEELR